MLYRVRVVPPGHAACCAPPPLASSLGRLAQVCAWLGANAPAHCAWLSCLTSLCPPRAEAFVEWSPRGSMLATVHRQGVALWGGQSFGRLMRVGHPGVQRLLFSPCERYMLTFSEFPDNRGRPHVSHPHPTPPHPHPPWAGNACCMHGRSACHQPWSHPFGLAPLPPQFVAHVWEVRTGKRLRTFDGPQEEDAVGALQRPDRGMSWPAFRWSGGVGGAPALLAHMKKNAVRWAWVGAGAGGVVSAWRVVGVGGWGGASGLGIGLRLCSKQPAAQAARRGITGIRRPLRWQQLVITLYSPGCVGATPPPLGERTTCRQGDAALSCAACPLGMLCLPSSPAACTRRPRWSCLTRRA